MRQFLALLPLLLAGCASGLQLSCVPHPTGHGCLQPVSHSGLPYDAWGLGFLAPDYMEVWVETVRVEDMRGRIFPNSGGGTVGISYGRDPAGWPERPGHGAGIDILGAALPKQIYMRWQSLVEPQTYEATLEIPEDVRTLMLTQAPSVRDPSRSSYRNRLVVGLAPGGSIKVWVSGTLGESVEAMCTQASVVPQGPSQGKTGGAYAYPLEKLEPATQRYLNEHSIPYDSWKCGNG